MISLWPRNSLKALDLVAAVLVGVAILSGAAVFLFVGTIFRSTASPGNDVVELVQGIKAGLNTIILAGIGVTLIGAEERIKRKQVSASCTACAR